MTKQMTGAESIAAERQRQIDEEGWTAKHDDTFWSGQLVYAAISYARARNRDSRPPGMWPWTSEWWKPKDYRSNLVRAGALIAAEIDRLDRATETNGDDE